jgi:signal transduction histidine kinase
MESIHPEDRADVERRQEVVLRERREVHLEYRYFTPDGTLKWISVNVRPLLDIRGAMTGSLGTVLDITSLHDAQQRQEDLLNIVSHDLRIPLTVIQAHTELLRAGLQQRHLDGAFIFNTSTIERNARRLNVMIQDLTDMARLESQRVALSVGAVNLQLYLPDLLARLHGSLPVQRVMVEITPNLPSVRADQNYLERILLNLLSNALKYSTADSPVRIQASRQSDEIIMAVHDQGSGIDPTDIPQLFDRFYRAKGERRAEGIGLGLYITKLLVEAHGGRIWVESQLGKGSTFYVTLPGYSSPMHLS